tara:strand:+ start:926 stop:1939 length:1014 start_codon:yes stop_codon:yes gene_type:complete
MSALIIGNNHFSEKISEKLKQKKITSYILRELQYNNLENIISNNNIKYIFNIGHKINNNYFREEYKKSDIILEKMKYDIFITEICIKNNIPLIYFSDINRIENISHIFKIYSEEKNLIVNVIKYGSILHAEYDNFISDTVQHISKAIINSKKSSILKFEDLNKEIHFNIDSEILNNIDKIINFDGKYNVIDYSQEKILLADITQNIIDISGKDVRIVGVESNQYRISKNIEQLSEHLQNTVHQIECQAEIDNLNISKEEINKIENILNTFDTDKDGNLDVRNLNQLFNMLNLRVDNSTFFKIFEDSDKNKDGKIDKKEFILLMKKGFNKNNTSNIQG